MVWGVGFRGLGLGLCLNPEVVRSSSLRDIGFGLILRQSRR